MRYGLMASCALSCFAILTFADVSFAGSLVRNLSYPHVENELLIKFAVSFSPAQQEGLLAAMDGTVVRRFRASGAVLARFKAGTRAPAALTSLARQLMDTRRVAYIEANTILHADVLPDDPKFGELYGLHNEGQNSGTADADIDAPEAWELATGSRDVVVGVIDTGINFAHPDLIPNLWTNPGETGVDDQGADKQTNGIDDDGNGFIDDWHGWDFVNDDNDPMDDNSHRHGSHCAGTIGANGNDGFGVVGVNWQVSLVGLKFLDANGSGSLDDAVAAIEYATLIGVDLTSNSWGGGGFSQVMYDAISEMQKKDIIFVASAGNLGSNVDEAPYYPGSYDHDNLISVAASDKMDVLAGFSNFGLNSVDVAAPGVDIVSTSNDADFRTLSGTSMAAPHVAGAVALIKSFYPDMAVAAIKSRVIYGVDPLPAFAGVTRGGGRLNLFRSLENDTAAPNQVTGFKVTEAQRTAITLLWDAAGDDADQGQASAYEVRYAAAPILTEEDWQNASFALVVSAFSAPPATITATMSGLAFNFTGHAAVRAVDNVGNHGPLSASLPVAVTEVRVLAENRAETMAGTVAEGLWGLEESDIGNGLVFSDSPKVWYQDNVNATLTLPAMTVDTAMVSLVYLSKAEIEKGYDFGYVDLSTDGGQSWQPIDLITGAKTWHTREIDLATKLGDQRQFQIRFRFTSDYVIQADGWYIDNVQIITDKN